MKIAASANMATKKYATAHNKAVPNKAMALIAAIHHVEQVCAPVTMDNGDHAKARTHPSPKSAATVSTIIVTAKSTKIAENVKMAQPDPATQAQPIPKM
jgi:hypothetical protein